VRRILIRLLEEKGNGNLVRSTEFKKGERGWEEQGTIDEEE
jgi:hypothetical protein